MVLVKKNVLIDISRNIHQEDLVEAVYNKKQFNIAVRHFM